MRGGEGERVERGGGERGRERKDDALERVCQ